MPAFSVPANLAFDNYTDLVAAIRDWMDRSDLSGSVQAMIALAESRMRRTLEPYFTETSTSIRFADGQGALPDDFSTLMVVRGGGYTLTQIGIADALDVPKGSLPLRYTLEADRIRVWPAVDAKLTVIYRPTLLQLSEANPTNELLSMFPDTYFFGAMLFAEGYVANDSRAATFKALFDEAMEETRKFLVRQSFGGPLVPRVAFVP